MEPSVSVPLHWTILESYNKIQLVHTLVNTVHVHVLYTQICVVMMRARGLKGREGLATTYRCRCSPFLSAENFPWLFSVQCTLIFLQTSNATSANHTQIMRMNVCVRSCTIAVRGPPLFCVCGRFLNGFSRTFIRRDIPIMAHAKVAFQDRRFLQTLIWVRDWPQWTFGV